MCICEQRELEGPASLISATKPQRFLTPQGSVFCSLDLNSNVSEAHTDIHQEKAKSFRCIERVHNHYGFLLKYDPSVPLRIDMQEVG